MEELYGFLQECAKVHSRKCREYVQCTEMIIKKDVC